MPRKHVDKTGRPPGWLEYTGQRAGESITAAKYTYSEEGVEGGEIDPALIDMSCDHQGKVCWMDVRGLHDTGLLERLGMDIGMTRLVIEDMLNIAHTPKLEIEGGFILLSLKYISSLTPSVSEVHVNLILNKNRVISISDTSEDLFEPVRKRLFDPENKLRSFSADHLFLRLADLVTDHYIPILNRLRDVYDDLQEKMIGGSANAPLQDVLRFRRELIVLRQAILPLRAALMEMQGAEHNLLSPGLRPYLRDVSEHLQQAGEEQRALYDAIPILLELHHANLSNHMNAVMKTLTVVASIFIPLTFLAGIYGMNFTYMPELDLHWAYPAVLGLMVLIAAGMVIFMRRKKWL